MKLLKGLSFVAISLALAALALEVLLRAAYPLYSNYNTEMWRYAALLKRPSDAPGLPFEHAPGRRARLYGVDVALNSQGWRAARDFAPQKPAGARRVLVVGDSIALGWGVALEDSFSERLSGKLNARPGAAVEVLNTGVGNYNLACESAMLRQAAVYAPDVVVLLLCVNDAEALPATTRTWLNAVRRRSYLYCFLWDKWTVLKYRLGIARPYWDHYRSLYREGSAERAAYERSAGEIVGFVRERGLPLVVAFIPELHQFRDYPFADITRAVRSAFPSGGGVEFLDLLDSFAPHEPSSIWVTTEDKHPNALGHKVMADAVHNELVRRGLF